MRWLHRLGYLAVGVILAGGATYLGHGLYLQNKQALTYMAVMSVVALGGILLFSKVLKDERRSKPLAFMGLVAAVVVIFGATSLWPMVVISHELLGKVVITIAIFTVGLGLMYYSVRNGKKKG